MVVLVLTKLLLDRLVRKPGAVQQNLIVHLQRKQGLPMPGIDRVGLYLLEMNLALRIEFEHVRPVFVPRRLDHLRGDFKRPLQADMCRVVHHVAACTLPFAISAK